MKKTFLILSLSLVVKFIYAQTVHLCEGDSLQKFSVLADNISNSMYWEFTSGSGAQFLSPQNSDEITINLACAHPAKFPDAIKKAIGHFPTFPEELKQVINKKEYFEVMENDDNMVMEYIVNSIS